ncbi:iron-sulfur cluster assembly scaffold protein [Mycoplasma sp. 128]
MTSFSDQQKRDLIYQHYLTPNNKSETLSGLQGQAYSRSGCADNLEIGLVVENNVIKNAQFSGSGCSIFISSTDLVLDLIKNKSTEEVKEILENYESMINQNHTENKELLNNLVVFENVKKHLNRVECASLIIRAVKKALNLE